MHTQTLALSLLAWPPFLHRSSLSPSLSLSRVVNTRPASPISLHTDMHHDHFSPSPETHPRRRQMETTAPQLSCSPAFTTAFVLFVLSFDYIHAYACMSLPKIKSFSSTRLLLHRMRCVHNHCMCHLTPLLQPSNVLFWTFVLLSRTPNKPLSI